MTAADTDLSCWRIRIVEATETMPALFPHLATVSLRAAALGSLAALDADDVSCLAVAGLLHDIGRVPGHDQNGFHPVDGAAYAAAHGAERAAELIAHHTGARYEARLLGIKIPWPWRPSMVHDALMLADLSTGQDGRVLSLTARREDIERRYAADSVPVLALEELWPEVLDAADRLDPMQKLINI